MKRFIISIFFIFAFLMGNAQSRISIKGKIKKSKTRKVWIYNYNKSISDTVRLNVFRKFKYKNTFIENELCFVKPLESTIPIVFSVESGSAIKFKTRLPDIHGNLEVQGNNVTSKVSEFFNCMSQHQYLVKETEQKLFTDETADGQYYYDSVLTSIQKENSAYKRWFIIENKNASTLLLINDFIDYENEYELLVELEKGLKENYEDTEMYEKVNMGIHKHKLFQKKVETKGDEAPMLILPGVDGKDVSMEDLSGNYILIDFWASWCAPCRAEHPRLTKLYRKYNDKGFEIYSVSLDKSKEKWLKAIEKDQLSWDSHVSSLKMFNCPSVNMYNIQALPFNALVDKEGNVIEINIKGKKLEEKLKQIFDENK